MKIFYYLLSFLFFGFVISCAPHQANISANKNVEKIEALLNDWHLAAANTNFDEYFSKMTENAFFLGTDATENWSKREFKQFAKPYFDKGEAWSFKSLEKNIYISKDGSYAWFNELLDTQMELCRGSGTLILVNNEWKIQHYVLSILIPNENVKQIVNIKALFDKKIKSNFN